MSDEDSPVWYACYGSNMCRERFLIYVNGGRWKLGGSKCVGCKDKTPPTEAASITIPHRLYFAKSSYSWQNGGIAFISTSPEADLSWHTYGRMWKITMGQFDCIAREEGPEWYGKKIKIGEKLGLPIYTFTNDSVTQPNNKPSDEYLKTMAIGLKETYQFGDGKIADYLAARSNVTGLVKQRLLNLLEEIEL